MKIYLSCEVFNAIMKATKFFVSKDTMIRPVYTNILLDCRDGKVKVTALDGIKILKMEVNAVEGTENGKLIIPWLKPFKGCNENVSITSDNGMIAIQTSTERHLFPTICDRYEEWDNLFEQKQKPKTTIYFNPKQLAKALSAFTNDVRIDVFGIENAIWITDTAHHQKAAVMPMRPPQKAEKIF